MRLKPRILGSVGLLLVVIAGIVFWRVNSRHSVPHTTPQSAAVQTEQNVSATKETPVAPTVFPSYLVATATNAAPAKGANAQLPHQLSNASQPIGKLVRNERAILLQNALIDTESSTPISIPESLRSKDDPGAYIVQARGSLSDRFRWNLKQAQAEIISYVPNNAYLVRVSASGAKQIANSALTQSVLPYEPYFKLDPGLLEAAVTGKPLPVENQFRVTAFPGQRQSLLEKIRTLGARVTSEDRSPFGPELIVQPGARSSATLVALAQSPLVQGIETFQRKVLANDLSRVRVGISADSLTTTSNYFNLSGTNILVNVNDTGVDAGHPDLTNRVFVGAFTLATDTEGHGTHVAGTIAATGENGPNPATNAPGSVEGASFRGMAHDAQILSQDFLLPDADLQEMAARTNYYLFNRTNALISNNSWHYVGVSSYNSAAASYDAAVRDAIPGATGPQPVLFVFAAGNDGSGGHNGGGGQPDSVGSPGTAKNVITVGGIENLRRITNEIYRPDIFGNMVTNAEFYGATDSSNQVMAASSRGNVGIGLEGEFGRFKPDVVAPGTFVVSTRSRQWDTNAYYNPTNIDASFVTNLVLAAGETNSFALFVPENGVGLRIQTLQNDQSPIPFPPLLIFTSLDFDPTPADDPANLAGTNSVRFDIGDPEFTNGVVYYYDIVNTNDFEVNYDLRTAVISTNDFGNYFDVLRGLNESLTNANGEALYRFESGTSMATPVVSGMLALMQQYFQQQGGGTNPTPALLKAMLINSARAAGPLYELQVNNSINLQGWGVPDIRRVLPGTNLSTAPILLFDQNPTNALATDDTETRIIDVSTNATASALRVTLVWTDPPGSPAVGVKLVNDLDLVVTNLDTGDVYFGNHFPGGGEFSAINIFNDTNGAVVLNSEHDVVNNVENVFITGPLSSKYSISVVGRRVNVNAVTTQTNGIRQDYALVVSSGDISLETPFTVSGQTLTSNVLANVTVVTNGIPLLNQRVGANDPLSVSTNGTTNQWRFYVLENTNGFTNVAFATFLPTDLSGISSESQQVPSLRHVDADIDLYVSTNPALTNLDTAAIAAATKSTKRGGDEVIILTNGVNATYYVGVKSEDQRAAEFAFFGIASLDPFAQQNPDGSMDVQFMPMPAVIPDGSPDKPGVIRVFGLNPFAQPVRRVIVGTVIEHELFGDLVGSLTHNGQFAILNNHSFPDGIESGVVTNLYNDLDEGDYPNAKPTDGPGSLVNFVGESGQGMWLLTMQDNAPTHIGTNITFNMHVEPQDTNTDGATRTILANRFVYDFINVPAEATNLIVEVEFPTPNAGDRVEVYLRKDRLPNRNPGGSDKSGIFTPPGGTLTLGQYDSPPLSEGKYYIGFYNPGVTSIQVRYRVRTELSLAPATLTDNVSTNLIPVLDDAVTNSIITITNDERVASVQVGVRLDHPRVSDLSLHLVSPQGTRVLLFENRGGSTTNGLGLSNPATTNSVTLLSGDFETNAAAVYASGSSVDGWFVSTNSVTLLNDTNANSGSQFLALRNGKIARILPTIAGRNYTLTYALRQNPLDPVSWWKGEGDTTDFADGNSGTLLGETTFAVGNVGQAFVLDGDGDGVDLGNPANLQLQDFTIEAWIKRADAAQISFDTLNGPEGEIFSYGSGGYGFIVAPDGQLLLTRIGIDNVGMPAGNWITDTNWHHVAVTKSGTTVVFYVDGTAYPAATPYNTTYTFTTSAAIGTRGDGQGNTFYGALDEVAVFDRPLAAAEIQDIFNAGALGKCGSSNPPTNCAPAGELVLNGILTNNFAPTTAWTTNTVTFTAPTAGTVLSLDATSSGVLLDSFELIEERIDAGYVYAVFTENTNLFPELLKFATPPYGTNNSGMTNSSFATNSFETELAGTYAVGSVIEGWSVLSSNVSVLTEPAFADSGTNVLALNTLPGTTNGILGAIEQAFPTIPGRSYTLSGKYRQAPSSLINWWAGENNQDSIGGQNGTGFNTTFTSGMVGTAFDFNGANGYVDFGTNAGNFGTNDFTVEFWIRTTSTHPVDAVLSKRSQCGNANMLELRMGDGVGNGRLVLELSEETGVNYSVIRSATPVNDGAFHHVAFSRQGTNVSFYVDGVLDVSTNGAAIANINNAAHLFAGRSPCISGVGPGATDITTYFNGQLDEIGFHNRAISPTEIQSLYLAGAAGRFDSSNPPTNAPPAVVDIIGEGATNTLTGGATWTGFTMTFTATTSTSAVQVVGVTNGMWLDSFTVSETGGGQYYYPEESLRLLVGENAKGNWKLEVWDNRAGAEIGAALLSWNLQLTFAPKTLPGEPPTLLTNGTNFTATVYTNQIRYFIIDAPVSAQFATNLLDVISGGPLDMLFSQSGLPTGSLPGDFTLLTSITNSGTNTLTTNTPAPFFQPGQRYYLGVRNTDPTQSNSTFTVRVDFDQADATALDVTPLTNGVAFATNIISGNALEYFQYDVSSNAASVAFEILGAQGNVDLYARLGAPLPNTSSYDYRSVNSGTNDELILVSGNSFPIMLTPGRWYLGVYNREATNVDYTIRATEQPSTVNTLDLIENTPTNFVSEPGVGMTNFFRFHIDDPATSAALIELYNAVGNVNLYVRKDVVPNIGEYDFRSINTGTNGEQILITTNDTFPDLSGDWFIGIPNGETTNVSFTLRGTMSHTQLAVTNSVENSGIAYYIVDVPDTATFASNILASVSGGSLDLLFNQTTPPTGSLPGDRTFLSAVTTGTNTFTTNGPAPVLQPGAHYFIGVRNSVATETNTFTLNVDMSSDDPASLPLTPLSSGVLVTTNISAGNALHYYQFDVSPGANAAQFEILNPDGNVDLYLQKAPSLPLPGSADYQGVKPGANDELISINDHSSPVPLSAGTWYLAVYNREFRNVTYSIRATEQGFGIITLIDAVPTNSVSRSGAPLTNYFRFVIDQTNSAALFELYNLSGNVDLLLRRNGYPAPTQFDFQSASGGTNAEQIVIRTNALMPDLNGEWFLAVPNNEAFDVNFTVRATVSTNGILFSGLPLQVNAPVLIPGGVRLEWNTVTGETYEVQQSPDLVTWTTIATVTASGPVMTHDVGTGGTANFYRIRQIPTP